jgi:uncharacterized membrane protein
VVAKGKVVQRFFFRFQHVQSCTATALKEALVGMLSSHNLSISMLHGQGYDGAYNMRGEFNDVQKKLIRDIMKIVMLFMCIVLLINCN